ncbi:MAG: F0F1 ATP synthase subunit A [Candidatus Gastranaerophilales bacterium]|nr:F0F1 ATP synthase subunit A [Candidatus Gastranaerophilales bacterium]
MSESSHWVVTKVFAGHAVSVNFDTILTMWLAMGILLLCAIMIVKNAAVIPTRIQYTGEAILNYFASITAGSMGEKESKKHNPLILTLFMFILTANLVGQIPFKIVHLANGELASPNNDINMTAAMAVVVAIYCIYYGVKANGYRYFFKGWSMGDLIITLIDTLELFVRPFSLALRLFANILAGEIMIATFVGMVACFVPLPFMLFELFVALIQALVFALLSSTYITMAVAEEH